MDISVIHILIGLFAVYIQINYNIAKNHSIDFRTYMNDKIKRPFCRRRIEMLQGDTPETSDINQGS